ncbi:MAG: hypothetical protein QOG60_378 [Frankiaceae bacterium]|nr:hypothetical protein [Frankiaceae bacterium]
MESAAGPDTAQRSLAHWSADGRAEMDAFYALAIEDYRQLVLAADWQSVFTAQAAEDWKLLDVACGSGKFPATLLRYADLSGLPPLRYDLLDPSAFSVAEAKTQLAPPFVAGRELVTDLQSFRPEGNSSGAGAEVGYDLVIAVHALYALPPDQLPVAAERLVAVRRPGGVGVVAQATARSHYLAFYDAYRAGVRSATPYTTAEQVRDALVAAGADVREQRVTYTTGTDDRNVAEGFLQRCAFDDTITLPAMEQAPVLGDYLAGCRTAEGGYRFSHEAALLWF